MLCLNGIYDANGYFWPVKPPTSGDLDEITYKIAKATSSQSNRLLVRIWMSLPTRLPGASHGSWRKQVTWSAMLSPRIWI